MCAPLKISDLLPETYTGYAHDLTGIVDENGSRYASWTYDAAGRASSSEHGASGSGIDRVGLAYGDPDASGNSTTSVTDVMGVNRGYTFGTLLGGVKNTGISGQPCNGCSASIAYDANGNVSARTDQNGNQTTYVYDLARNLETARTEGLTAAGATTAATRTVLTTWHPTFRLPASITEQDASGATAITLRTTTLGYDLHGNLLTKTLSDGLDPAATRTTTYSYNAAGQVLSVDGPRTDVSDITRYAYDTKGNLTTVTNPLNRITTLGGYDANGRPGTVTDPNGLITALAYDARGRLLSRNTGGEITGYTYDGAGNLSNVALPGGAAYTYTYDAAHRLTSIADNLGNHISYTLDAAGNRTQEQTLDAAGNIIQSHRRVFDALNRLYQDIGAVNQTTTYSYDANGNLTGVVDPLTRSTTNTYDALDRLITSTDPASGLSSYGYDALDQLARVTDPRNLLTQYSRDALGNLKQQASPDTGVTTNTYDAAGNLLTRTDAKGQTASYAYDTLNRPTSITYTGGIAPAPVIYQYDQGANGIGHLTGITEATAITGYTYDSHGRTLTETRQAYGTIYLTAYSYDARGRLNAITYPSGRTVNYTFDSLGRINQIATSYNGTTQTLASNIAYRPFGGVQSYTYGNGQTHTRQYDQNGRLAAYTLNGQTTSIGYDAASQIATVSDPSNNPASYSYDPVGRLSGFTQGTIAQAYTYDADGNRTGQTLGATSTLYGYGASDNRLNALQSGGNAPQTVVQDALGATVADATRQYAYDARGRLIQSTTAQGTTNYEVNTQGLRVRKQSPDADTLYHYDLQGRLIAESAKGTNQFAREYIYLGEQPLAVMDATSQQPYYVHADHLDTPRQITDTAGNTVWQWDNTDPFGANIPNENPSGQGTFVYNQRFAGQYFDKETGLHQNHFRDGYNPAIGAYTQSDPIGLRGGSFSTYTYVNGNPLSKIDPLGLWSFSMEAYLGIGGGINVAYSNGTWELTGRLGVGLGEGLNYDPNGTPSPQAKNCGSGYIARTSVNAQAGIGVGPAGVGGSFTAATGNALTTKAGGGYSSFAPVGAFDSSGNVGVRASASLGAEFGSYWNK